MKVCLLNDSFPPVIDGVVNVMMNYATYLMQDDQAQICVGTPEYPEADYTGYPYKVVPYQSFDTAAVTNGYRTGNPFSRKPVAELASFAPDIIHAHCPASATVIGRILREETGAPLIFTYHTKYEIDIQRAVKIKSIAEEGVKAMVGNIEGCDDVWVVSRGAGESLRSLGFTGDYLVMNNGVDFEKGRPSQEVIQKATASYDLPEGVPMFLYVGRLMTYKGLPIILDALKMLDEQGMDFRMAFVGKGPDRELLENKARELGLMDRAEGKDKVFFTGPVYDREALRAWNARADLFLFPSTFDTNGLVVREAAACGLASVLIKDSCAAEGITDGRNGFIIEENAASMAALLKKVGGDLPYLHEVGSHAMEEIYLSWRTCVATAYDRYQFILEEKKAGRLAKKKLPTDILVEMTAKGMENSEKMHRYLDEERMRRQLQEEKIRKLGEELFSSFRESAVGMMENMQDAQDSVEQLFSSLKDSAEGVRESMQEAHESMEQLALSMKEQMKESVKERMEKMKEIGPHRKELSSTSGSSGED